jgi:hypothetical protein
VTENKTISTVNTKDRCRVCHTKLQVMKYYVLLTIGVISLVGNNGLLLCSWPSLELLTCDCCNGAHLFNVINKNNITMSKL